MRERKCIQELNTHKGEKNIGRMHALCIIMPRAFSNKLKIGEKEKWFLLLEEDERISTTWTRKTDLVLLAFR